MESKKGLIKVRLKEVEEILLKNHLLKKYNINQIGIFGSIARGENGNDIDILINDSSKIKNSIELKKELENITNTKVDIMIEKYANPIVLYRAKKELIYVEEY